MKKMEYTTKTECNRRNSESRIVKLCLNVMPSRDGGRRSVNRRNSESRIVKLCLNVMPSRDGGRQLANPLSLRDLGGEYRLCRNVFIHI